MENLQRQQAARLALEEKLRSQAEKDKDLRAVLQQQQHELAFRHYQASVRGALEAHRMAVVQPRATEDSDADDERTALDDDEDERDMEEEEEEDDSVNDDGDVFEGPLAHFAPRHAARSGDAESPKSAHALSRVQPPYTVAREPESPNAQPQHHEWTYEEQFKQVRKYEQELYIYILKYIY